MDLRKEAPVRLLARGTLDVSEEGNRKLMVAYLARA